MDDARLAKIENRQNKNQRKRQTFLCAAISAEIVASNTIMEPLTRRNLAMGIRPYARKNGGTELPLNLFQAVLLVHSVP